MKATAMVAQGQSVDVQGPLVSVIIAFYNAESCLERTLNSVCEQTYKHWELLLIDDGSSDRSSAIARKLAVSMPKQVRYLEHAGHVNRGRPASKNLGAREARGELIATVDADDVWVPQKLERQVALLTDNPDAEIILGAVSYRHEVPEGAFNSAGKIVTPQRVMNRLFRPPELALVSLPLRNGRAPCPSDLLLQRRVVERVGGFEESFVGVFQSYEDHAFLVKLYLTSFVFVSDETWLDCSIHEPSLSGKAALSEPSDQARRFYLEWLQDFLNRQNVREPAVRAALNRALRPYRDSLFASASLGVRKFLGLTSSLVRERTRPLRVSRPLRYINRWLNMPSPRPGMVRFGSLRRTTPISRLWGLDRGRPLDRYYIEAFLAEQRLAIRGRVLEIGDDRYTRMYGDERISVSDVLHLKQGSPNATIVADLTSAPHIPSEAFDCIILVQTLQLIFDVPAALRTVYRILKPGGILLATFPGITHTGDEEWDEHWCWSFTRTSARLLFTPVFGDENVFINSHGNVLAATALLYGLTDSELKREELDLQDPAYDVVITLRATRSEKL